MERWLGRIPRPPPMGRRAALLFAPAFVAGAAAYMSLWFEPEFWPAATVFFALTTLVLAVWRNARLRTPALCLLALGLGFIWALARADMAASPRLDREGAGALRGVATWVEAGEGRPRLELRDVVFKRYSDEVALQRARVRLLPGARVKVGEHVEVRAVLRPPPPPAAPGAYDFRRNAYFKQIGAVGFAIGKAKVTPAEPGGPLFAKTRADLRDAVYKALSDRPEIAGVIAALTVGDRAGVSEEDNDALRASGLAHLLAISGLHLGMAAGGVYLMLRLILAAPHGAALRFPVHKVAAVAAILAAVAYLGLSGAAPPAQRAFIMVLAGMIAVLCDRLRSGLWFVAWAAVAVVAVAPHVVVGPSFQLSFAAATGIVAVYEALSARGRRLEEPAFAGFGRLRPVVVYVAGVAGASLIATASTAPLALIHFQQAPAFGVVANLAAMPVMAFIVMPMAVIAGLLAPFGLADAPLWAMAEGVSLILLVAHEVASWPGGVIRAAAAPDWASFAFLMGGALFIILRGWPRFLALVGPALTALALTLASPPDILADEEARLAAVVRDGTLYVTSERRGRFHQDVWLRLAGAARVEALSAASWAACDDRGCVFKLNGRQVAISTDPSGLRADCARANLVLALHEGRAPCFEGARVVHAGDLARMGAHAIRVSPTAVGVETVGGASRGRVWTRPSEALPR